MLVGIHGPMGTGKSLTAVALTLQDQEETGRKIFSTMHLYSAYDCTCGERHREDVVCPDGEVKELLPVNWEFITLKSFYDWTKQFNEGEIALQNAVVLLDESYLFMGSRTSSSQINRMFNNFVFQTRKRNVDLYLTTHSMSRIDKWVRESIDIMIVPRWIAGPREKKIFSLKVVNRRQVGEHRIILNGPNFFAFFDTEEIVRPQGKLYRIKEGDLV